MVIAFIIFGTVMGLLAGWAVRNYYHSRLSAIVGQLQKKDWELVKLEGRFRSLEEEKVEWSSDQENLIAKVRSLEVKLEELQGRHDKLMKSRSKLRKEYNDLQNTLKLAEARIKELKTN